MSEFDEIRNLMVAALYGEADEEELRRLEAGLARDEVLAEEYRLLRTTLAEVERADLAGDPGKAFWRSVWPRVRRSLEGEGRAEERRILSGRLTAFPWRPALQFVFVAAMLVVGIFIGRFLGEQEVEPAQPPAPSITAVSFPYEDEIEAREQDFIVDATLASLERSESVLQEFLDVEPGRWGDRREAFFSNLEASYNLFDELAELRGSLRGGRYGFASTLLDELEIILGDIAGIEVDDDLAFEIERLQQDIADRRLLVRIREIEAAFPESRPTRALPLRRANR